MKRLLAALAALLMAAVPVKAATQPSISIDQPGPYHVGDIITLTVETGKLKGYEFPVVLIRCGIIDLGEGADIHPRNKLEVAKRLARWALARDYGRDIVCQSPRYESIEISGDTIVVKFKDVGGSLRTIDENEVQGFAIAGEDRKWVSAEAKIVAPDQVAVQTDKVSSPVAVRYAWADNPVCNLYNNLGLPVTPFRTDDWPGVTMDAR